jgi:hypothetical protein
MTAPEFTRDSDLRGCRWLITDRAGKSVTEGTVPALLDDGCLARAGYYMDMADEVGGDLYLVDAAPAPVESADPHGLIFGLRWDEIQALQAKASGRQTVSARDVPSDAVLVFSSQSTATGDFL